MPNVQYFEIKEIAEIIAINLNFGCFENKENHVFISQSI